MGSQTTHKLRNIKANTVGKHCIATLTVFTFGSLSNPTSGSRDWSATAT